MTTLTPNGDDDVIAAFMQEFEAAADKAEVVRQFADRHPDLGPAFAEFVEGREMIARVVPNPRATPQELGSGDMLGDFRVIRFVARGGMGDIYEAEQLHLNRRRVALKVIRRGHVSAEARARFMREQAVLARLHQTNIVPVFAAGEQDRLQYFAMQYLDGASLNHVVRFLRSQSGDSGSRRTPTLAKLVEGVATPRSPNPDSPTASTTEASHLEPLNPPAVLTPAYLRSLAGSLADVAEALDVAHKAGVVHRDIKPANLIAEKSGKCWVIDFGLAGVITAAGVMEFSPRSDGSGPTPFVAALTTTDGVMGTYPYMAPEQFEGRADPRSDVWSLGATLYELLSLNRPFPGPTREDYVRQVNAGGPPPLPRTSIPTDLEAICRRALQKDPAKRYQTANAFGADLRRWLRNEPTVASPPWVWRRARMWAWRNPGWASALALACLATFALLGVELQRRETAAARARADFAKTQAEVADQRTTFLEDSAARDARHRSREERIVDLIRQARLPVQAYGWRDRLLASAHRLIAEETDPVLRDQLVSFLAGLDARLAREFDEGIVGTLAFGPADNRLLIAGYGPPADRRRSPRAHFRDLATGATAGTSPGPVGDVAWRNDVPVQLVAPITRPALEVWDLGGRGRLDEFVYPEGFQPMPTFARIVLAALTRSRPLPAADFPGPTVQAVALSADGTHAAALVRTARDARSVLVWRTGDPAPRAVIPTGAADPVHFGEDVVLSPDGSLVALGMVDGRVRVWDVARGPQPVATLTLSGLRVTAMAFARHRAVPDPDRQHPNGIPGWLLAAGDGGGGLVVWDLGRLERVSQTRYSHHEVSALAFGPDGETLYTAGRSEVRAWDVTTGRVLLHLHPKHGVTTALAMSPSGSRLGVASCNPQSGDGWVEVFDLESGRGIQTLRGLAGQVCRVTTAPDQKRVAAMTLGFQVGVWDRATGSLLMKAAVPRAFHGDHADIRLTDDGRFLVVAGGEEARRYELPAAAGAPARLTDVWKLPPAFSTRLGIAADGTVRLCRTETRSGTRYPDNRSRPDQDPRRVVIYRLPPGREPEVIRKCDDHPWHVFDIEAVPDGSCFVVTGVATQKRASTSIVGYAGPTGEPLWRIPLPNAKGDAAAHLDSSGRVMAYGTGTGEVLLRESPFEKGQDVPVKPERVLALGRRYCFLPVPTGLAVAAFDADRPFLVLDPDQQVGHTWTRFSPDGRWLTWGNRDGTVKVADLNRVRDELVSAGFPGWD